MFFQKKDRLRCHSIFRYIIILIVVFFTLYASFACTRKVDLATQTVLDIVADDHLPLTVFKDKFSQAVLESGDSELIAMVESLLGLIAGDKAIQEFRDVKKQFTDQLGIDPTDLTSMVTKPLDMASAFFLGEAGKKSFYKPEEVMEKMILKVLAEFLKANSQKIKKKGLKGFLGQFLADYKIPAPGISSPSSSSDRKDVGGGLETGDCVYQQFKPNDLIARTMGIKAELFGEIVDLNGHMAKVYWKCQNAYAADRTNIGEEFIGKTTDVPVKYLSPCSGRGLRSISDVLRGDCR